MNDFIRKFAFVWVLALLVSAGCNVYLILKDAAPEAALSLARSKPAKNLPLNKSASCTFESETDMTYTPNVATTSRNVDVSVSRMARPFNISFTNLDTEKPTMFGDGGAADLKKIIDTDEMVTVIESKPMLAGRLQMFTIFKKTGIGLWSIQYDVSPQVPFGLSSMGYCE